MSNFVCDPATCVNTQHDHTMSVDHVTGENLSVPAPQICGDCHRPTFYDYATDQYRHNVNPERGCFLIPAEIREESK